MIEPCRRSVPTGRAPRALCLFVAFACALLLLSVAPRAHAYTWMIKHGYSNCGACHSDPSGGELLTQYGRAMSQEFLSSRWGGDSAEEEARSVRRQLARARAHAAGPKLAKPSKKKPAADEEEEEEEEGFEEDVAEDEEAVDEEDADASEEAEAEADAEASSEAEEAAEEGEELPFAAAFFGLVSLPEPLLLGGSVRVASLYNPDADSSFRVFPMQLDLYGELRISQSFRAAASIGAASVRAGSPHARAAQITTNQGDGFRVISRTHWLAFDFGGGHSLRVGRMNLPFGVRIPEHTAWVRERTETDRESDQQHGVALAMNFQALRFEVMGIAGNYQSSPSEFHERGYSAYLELMAGERAAFGLSSLTTYAARDRSTPEDDRPVVRQVHGAFTRVGIFEELALLAEVDAVTRSRRELGYVGFLQLDFEPARGLHLLGTLEGVNTNYPSNPVTPLAGFGESTQERIPGTGEFQLGYWIGAQWFFAPHFDFRVDAMFRKGEPMQVLSQFHVYL